MWILMLKLFLWRTLKKKTIWDVHWPLIDNRWCSGYSDLCNDFVKKTLARHPRRIFLNKNSGQIFVNKNRKCGGLAGCTKDFRFHGIFSITGAQSTPLESEVWYHGPMSRAEAELLLEDEGDFLVRESKSKAGQYVLSGVQNGQPRHLLLVDPEGKVRTAFCHAEKSFLFMTMLL